MINQLFVFASLFKQHDYYNLLTQNLSKAIRFSDSVLLGHFYTQLAYCEWWHGYLNQAIKTSTKAAKLIKDSEIIGEGANPFYVMQWAYLWKGDFDKVFSLNKEALKIAKKQHHFVDYVNARVAVSWAHSFLGNWDRAVEEGKKALRIAEENDSLISLAAFAISLAYNLKRDTSRALEFSEFAARKAKTIAEKVWAQSGLAWALIRTEDPLRGVEIATELLPMFQAVGFMGGELLSRLAIGEAYYLAQKYDQAADIIKEGLEMANHCGMKYHIAWAHRLLGDIALQSNQTLAEQYFDNSIAVLREIKAENELALAFAGYGRIYKNQGEIAKAREYLSEALQIFERLGTLIEPDKVRKELSGMPEA